MRDKVMIRVDGSNAIGLGHIVRCIALAHMIKELFQVHFFSKEIPESIINNIVLSGFEFTKIEDETSFFERISGHEILVLDNYFFDTSYQKKLKETTGCKLVCIDDLHDKEFYADLIINHAPGVIEKDYKAQPYTQFALGLDYALLRSGFLKEAQNPNKEAEIETVFVCFGGSDIRNITSKCLSVLTEMKEIKKIIVVLGVSFQSTLEVINIAQSVKKVELHQGIDEKKMIELLKKSDLAIVPSSSILLETISVGCKVISGMYVENQKFIYQYYKTLNLIIDAGKFEVDSIKKAVELSFESKFNSIKSIDGFSGQRIKKMFFALNVNLRNLVEKDCQLMFNWANDPDVRNNAFQSENIIWKNHLDWFMDKMNNPNSQIYILERNGVSIGQIRFDKEKDYWKIDYSIDRNYRGLGMGTNIVKLGIKKIQGELKAWVKSNNMASRKVFENLGFRDVGKEDSIVEYSLINS
jgi:UDP-2,4-diacetamido-2,4,6-trideoxy-beta-L-altropyranose hydrolase